MPYLLPMQAEKPHFCQLHLAAAVSSISFNRFDTSGWCRLETQRRGARCYVPVMQEGAFKQCADIRYVPRLAMRCIYISSAPSVMKPCSHVTCKTCTDTLVRPANQCVLCDKLLVEGDVLELKREGESLLSTYIHFVLGCYPRHGLRGRRDGRG